MIIGRKINEIFKFNVEHTYFFHQGNWYHHLKRFPGILADLEGYVRFETKKEYLNNSYLKHGQRLHIKNGISSMPNFVNFNEEQLFILNQILEGKNIDRKNLDNNNQAERKPRNIDTIVRNQTLVRKVKKIRNHTCQICSLRLQIGSDSCYSEVHHIKPLGKPHNGPDIIGNMLCVCPNCHKKLDYGFISVKLDSYNMSEHVVSDEFIKYHNDRVKNIKIQNIE